MASAQSFVRIEATRARLNNELDNFLRQGGFEPTIADWCVYKHREKVLIILIYVDDILIGYDTQTDLELIMKQLHDKYDIKDLELSWFLGMCLKRDFASGTIMIDQEQHASEIRVSTVKTPMDQGTILYKAAEDDELATLVPYRQAVVRYSI
ncbi:Transposable element [Phytophthora megakarya]|uniref:Transposable element n=1 Tax=Phytophthora megakarya TaxID=4795 RepID=A0A225UJK4_9STRA|nr:Transposable element [Phytophthora megakarya]